MRAVKHTTGQDRCRLKHKPHGKDIRLHCGFSDVSQLRGTEVFLFYISVP